MTHAELRIIVVATLAGLLLALLAFLEGSSVVWRVRLWRKRRARGGYVL